MESPTYADRAECSELLAQFSRGASPGRRDRAAVLACLHMLVQAAIPRPGPSRSSPPMASAAVSAWPLISRAVASWTCVSASQRRSGPHPGGLVEADCRTGGGLRFGGIPSAGQDQGLVVAELRGAEGESPGHAVVQLVGLLAGGGLTSCFSAARAGRSHGARPGHGPGSRAAVRTLPGGQVAQPVLGVTDRVGYLCSQIAARAWVPRADPISGPWSMTDPRSRPPGQIVSASSRPSPGSRSPSARTGHPPGSSGRDPATGMPSDPGPPRPGRGPDASR